MNHQLRVFLNRFVAVAASILAGCGGPPLEPAPLTEQQALASRRIYQGVSEDDILAAARAILTQARPPIERPDILDTPEGIRARIRSLNPFSFGRPAQSWAVNIRRVPEGLEATLGLFLRSARQPGGRFAQGTAVYSLFWARMDYMLGRNPRWVTCDEAEKGESGIGPGELEPLCGDPRVPPAPVDRKAAHDQAALPKPECRKAAYRCPSREEWLKTTSRTYQGLERTRVLDAAVQVLKLADPKTFKINRDEDSVYATRSWSTWVLIGVVEGADEWEIRTYATNDAVTVWVYVTGYSQLQLPTGLSGGGVSSATPGDGDSGDVHSSFGRYEKVAASPDMAQESVSGHRSPTVFGSAQYELFFARLEFLLGLRDDWMTCDESSSRIRRKDVSGDNHALCAHARDDTPPPTRPRP